VTQATDIDRAIDRVETALEAAADARARAEEMEERKKQVYATMFVKYRGDGKAIGESEQMARADPVYQAAASDWTLANFDYRRADAKAEAMRLRFEAWRTKQSTERAKMRLQ
jgi:hypothetical protein